MSAPTAPPAIGFPPPLLGAEPVRLPILGRGEGWLALEKPAGVLAAAHPWYPDTPILVDALRQQLAEGKPELKRLGMGEVYPVAFLDPDISGPVLLALNCPARNALRNGLGSDQLIFTYRLLVQAGTGVENGLCQLPLMEYTDRPLAKVSHRYGKRSRTEFRCLQQWRYFSEWEARLAYPRPHQLRLHAAEWGLRVLGETRYSTPDWVQALPPRLRRSLPTGLGIRLESVAGELPTCSIKITADEPKRWRALKRQAGSDQAPNHRP